MSTQNNKNNLSVGDKITLNATSANFPKMPAAFLAELTGRNDGSISSFCEQGEEAIIHFGSMHSLQVPIVLLEKQ